MQVGITVEYDLPMVSIGSCDGDGSSGRDEHASRVSKGTEDGDVPERAEHKGHSRTVAGVLTLPWVGRRRQVSAVVPLSLPVC